MPILLKLQEILSHGAIVLGPFASLVILKKSSRQGFLVGIIMCLSVIVSHSSIIGTFMMNFVESPFVVEEPFIFLLSPLFYFYFLNISGKKIKLHGEDIFHFLPLLLFFASFVPISLLGKDTLYYRFLFENKIVITAFTWILLLMQFLYYMKKIHDLNRAYIAKLSNEHSNYHQFDASWVRTFLIVFLISFAFVFIIFAIFLHTSAIHNFNKVVALFFSLQVFYVSFKGLTQKVPQHLEAKETIAIPANDAKNEWAEQKEKLTEFMLKEKPYLNPELTLVDLAQQFGMSRNQLSALINNGINSNFYLFINEYRVKHIKVLMQEDRDKHYTILALAFDSGFNSKSTFNSIFKKITGLTPSEYRNGLS